MEKFGPGYEDYLQPPMQPLSDNLDSRLSGGIEKDPTKYEWYERAIAHTLTDWDEKQKPTSGPDKRVVIAVVGPGPGLLVTRALRASDTTKVPVEMWAAEKNPLTYVVLEQHNKHDWGGVVNIVHSDIRAWKGPSWSASDAKVWLLEKSTFSFPNSWAHFPIMNLVPSLSMAYSISWRPRMES
jgi:type II protein arginine methyltransferase